PPAISYSPPGPGVREAVSRPLRLRREGGMSVQPPCPGRQRRGKRGGVARHRSRGYLGPGPPPAPLPAPLPSDTISTHTSLIRNGEPPMAMVRSLAVLALRQVASGAAQAAGLAGGDALARFLGKHFTDHSQRLTAALRGAGERAWQALEVALAG